MFPAKKWIHKNWSQKNKSSISKGTWDPGNILHLNNTFKLKLKWTRHTQISPGKSSAQTSRVSWHPSVIQYKAWAYLWVCLHTHTHIHTHTHTHTHTVVVWAHIPQSLLMNQHNVSAPVCSVPLWNTHLWVSWNLSDVSPRTVHDYFTCI